MALFLLSIHYRVDLELYFLLSVRYPLQTTPGKSIGIQLVIRLFNNRKIRLIVYTIAKNILVMFLVGDHISSTRF